LVYGLPSTLAWCAAVLVVLEKMGKFGDGVLCVRGGCYPEPIERTVFA
jgi:hypothetical protein